ncbi:MAG TPA: 3'-5' exonuclease [Edaphocola sp.]|nr:3'-5' exonuclease [Edaphocola sp.]
MTKLKLERPLAFFDLETTGVDTAKDRIVEIAIVKLMPDSSRQEYVKRINPEMHIPEQTTAIHGITDEDVKDAPTFKAVAHEINNFIKDCDLAGYNSNRFDIPCLVEEFLRAGVPVDFKSRKLVDVQQVFYKMEPRTLSAAYKFYCQKEHKDAHAAKADVDVTIEILEAQLAKYNEEIGTNVNDLHKFTGGDEFVDYARRVVLKDGIPIFNFGKHKGKPVAEVFKKEPQYYDWMMQADFALHTKQCISEILNQTLLKR